MSILEASGAIQTAKVALSGDADLVVATTGFRIRVLGGLLVAGAAGATLSFKSNTTAISGTMTLAANSVMDIPPSGLGYFETAAGEKLAAGCTGAVNGVLRYQLIR